MVVAIAVPVFAATAPQDQEIEPKGVVWCSACGAGPSDRVTRWDTINYGDKTSGCTQGAGNCKGDYTARKYQGEKCGACGTVYVSGTLINVGVYCPGKGGYFYV